ncbi:MAG: hypothetical protein P8171_18615 [Candidatus Thiodiazotropha sp.]
MSNLSRVQSPNFLNSLCIVNGGFSTYLTHLSLAFVIAICTACTGGHVSQNGAPVAGAEVSIWTCESQGDFITHTNNSGNYAFNPYSANSSAVYESLIIPPGPIAINVTSGSNVAVTRRSHAYDESCPIQYDGATEDLPCKIHNIDFQPMTFQQLTAVQLEFIETDCGFSANEAQQLIVIQKNKQESQNAEEFDLAAKPGSSGCLQSCRASCLLQDPEANEISQCLCSCVEGQCDTAFGALCNKALKPSFPDK